MSIHQISAHFYAATPLWLWPWLWWQLERMHAWQRREGVAHILLGYRADTYRVYIKFHSPSFLKPRPWQPMSPPVPRYETDAKALDAPPLWAGDEKASVCVQHDYAPPGFPAKCRLTSLLAIPPPVPLAASPDLIRGLLRHKAPGQARRHGI